MDNLLLLGDEAIAQGGIDAGMSGIYAYPGTPSTEITEYIQASKEASQKGIRSSWSANEKTAYEAALGMSYAGKRSGLHETCGPECCCRCLYEFSHHRSAWWYGSSGGG